MNWSELIEVATKADWPSDEKKGFVKNGLAHLQRFFGDSVLDLKSYHPCFSETYNMAVLNLQRYAEFGHRLSTICSLPNSSILLTKIRKCAKKTHSRGSIENFFGCFYEVEIASHFSKQCSTVEFFPKTSTTIPDLRVKIHDRWLNIEVTNLRDPASYWDAEKFKATLRDTIVKEFSTEPITLQIEIRRFWDDIKNFQDRVILEIIEGIRILLNSSSSDNQMNLHGIQIKISRIGSALTMLTIDGPQWNIDYLRKIHRTINDKSKQLQLHVPAVIIICDCVFNSPELRKILPIVEQGIENKLTTLPHISGVMLLFDEMNMSGVERWSINESNTFFTQYSLCDNTRLLSKLLVLNHEAEMPLTLDEINLLIAYPEIT